MSQPGDKVKLITEKEEVEGLLIPSPKKEIVILKLDNGYNVGYPKEQIKDIVVIKEFKKLPKPDKTQVSSNKKIIQKNKKLPTISILHTGGTIASKVDYRTGGVSSDFSPEELISLFPELSDIANIESELISQMWSDDLRFAHFSIIAKAIEKHAKKGVKGIIVGIGTDNLSVASAALSFIVEKTPIPILLVGAQRSSDRGSSDAGMNLICAAEFITKTDFSDVAICMHGSSSDEACFILPANKIYKLHSSRRDAFKAVNTEAIARVGYNDRKVVFLKSKDKVENSNMKPKTLVIKPKMEEKVGLLKIHVNMFPEQFAFFKGYNGLIIEGTGLGHTPGQIPNEAATIHKKIYPAIKEVIDSGCVVVMTTQCIFGGVNMNVYDKGRDLLELGVISGKDMLANTALVKLSWLLANYPKEVKEKMESNLRGEINETISYEEDFLK
jgi:glutamyl-tRNA(Gln) amidotransferase subunit D